MQPQYTPLKRFLCKMRAATQAWRSNNKKDTEGLSDISVRNIGSNKPVSAAAHGCPVNDS